MVDTNANRLDVAKTFGATKLVYGNAVDEIMKPTHSSVVMMLYEEVNSVFLKETIC